jgi:cellulose synthase/poly-beta-1,6-N-acetylglucosamine synthase-like glycosyltransferase
MSVSIIIPAWNESKTLKATLEALLGIDYDKTRCEIIVIAGGDDNTYEIAQRLSTVIQGFSRYVVVPQSRQKTKNAAIQLGIEEARNDVIILLDADTIVSKDWLKNMVEPIKEGSCDLTIANSEPVKQNWISDYYMVIKTYFFDNIVTYPGHSVGFKADIVEDQIDYFFDDNVWMGDDYVFEKRVLEQGRKTMFIKNAKVKTHFPCSLKYLLEIEFRWMTAFIDMNGVNYRTLTRNVAVIGALVCAVPFSKMLSIFSLLFNALYIAKRVHMFLVASRQYDTKFRRIFGFVVLSYVHHIILFVSHIRCFLGLHRDTYYQGQRY